MYSNLDDRDWDNVPDTCDCHLHWHQVCDICQGTTPVLDTENTRKLAAKKEVIVTDPKTGGQKGSKLARFSLIPAQFLWALAEHYGKGASKYEARNWERGYAWTLGMDALERHYNQWKSREDIDAETGTHHLIAVAWHAAALYMFQLCGLGTDDRSELQEKQNGSDN